MAGVCTVPRSMTTARGDQLDQQVSPVSVSAQSPIRPKRGKRRPTAPVIRLRHGAGKLRARPNVSLTTPSVDLSGKLSPLATARFVSAREPAHGISEREGENESGRWKLARTMKSRLFPPASARRQDLRALIISLGRIVFISHTNLMIAPEPSRRQATIMSRVRWPQRWRQARRESGRNSTRALNFQRISRALCELVANWNRERRRRRPAPESALGAFLWCRGGELCNEGDDFIDLSRGRGANLWRPAVAGRPR